MDYPIKIRQLYISDGHNYFGQANNRPEAHKTHTVEHVMAVAGQGLEGDRFFYVRPDFDGQVTFFSAEVFQLLKAELADDGAAENGMVGLSAIDLRRNVIIEGVPLNQLIGKNFAIRYPDADRSLEFSGVRHCNPCRWMDIGVGTGALKFLKGRGGLRAKITLGGLLKTGSAILSTDSILDLGGITQALPKPRLP